MADRERAAVFGTLSLLCAAIAEARGAPLAWFFAIGALLWMAKGILALLGSSDGSGESDPSWPTRCSFRVVAF
jgi:hypothetical protein